jgi:23S rRNA (adenine2503-C2)-methyltransferase
MELEGLAHAATAADTAGRPCVLDYSLAELEHLMQEWGEPAYRARQLWEWMYKHYAPSYAAMRTLPKRLRDRLEAETVLDPISLEHEWVAEDRLTFKGLFRLQDGLEIESVLLLHPSGSAELDAGEEPMSHEMPGAWRPASPSLPAPASRPRETVCVSTQVGCAVGCPFCATGYSGFSRNLTTGEIVAQVRFFARHPAAHRLTNVVFMGQGEPLANFDAVWKAVETLNSPYGFGIGAKHITISTSGIVPRILELAEKPLHVRLAVSLHAPNDGLRDRLVPLNRRWPIRELLAACRRYIQLTQRRITFEYILIEGINDDLALADELAALLRGIPCHVNLIPMNPIAETDWHRPSTSRVLAFQRVLLGHGINTTVRGEKGDSIEAACGQLRNRDEAARLRAGRRMQKPVAAALSGRYAAAPVGATPHTPAPLSARSGSLTKEQKVSDQHTKSAPPRQRQEQRSGSKMQEGERRKQPVGRVLDRQDGRYGRGRAVPGGPPALSRPAGKTPQGEARGSVRPGEAGRGTPQQPSPVQPRRRSPRDYAEQQEAARRARYSSATSTGLGRPSGGRAGSNRRTQAPRDEPGHAQRGPRPEESRTGRDQRAGPVQARFAGRDRRSGTQQRGGLLGEVKQPRREQPSEEHPDSAKRRGNSRPRGPLKRT